MTFSFAVAAAAFALIFPVELPDKTFIATLVLATRFRPLYVWIGVAAAFLVQTIVACTAGAVLTLLPEYVVQLVALVMFVIGGVVLLRGASQADAEEAEAEEEFGEVASEKAGISGLRVISTCFLVLFLAEWGDLSQLLTANLVIKYGQPLSVGVGAFLALALISGLAAVLGRSLLRHIPLAVIRRVGGGVCLLLALVTALEMAGVIHL